MFLSDESRMLEMFLPRFPYWQYINFLYFNLNTIFDRVDKRATQIYFFVDVPRRPEISNTRTLEFNVMENVTQGQKVGRLTKTKEYDRTSPDLQTHSPGSVVLMRR